MLAVQNDGELFLLLPSYYICNKKMSKQMPLKFHQNFVENVINILKDDNRFVGLAAGGSWINNHMDEYSDIDLILPVEDDFYDEIEKDRKSIAAKFGELIASFTGEHVGEPRLLVCLYNDPLIHVDLKFQKISDLKERIEDPVILWERDGRLTEIIDKKEAHFPMPDLQWIEDRYWLWIHYLTTKLGRGELFELIEGLSFLRVNVLGPLAKIQHGHLPRGMRYIEEEIPEEMIRMLKTLSTHQKEECAIALEAAIQLYTDLRDNLADDDLNKNVKAEMAVKKYFEAERKKIN